jgi:hypothetical protein
MIATFKSTASGTISESTFTANILIARSSQAADAGNLTITGLDEAPSQFSLTSALTGKREVAFDLFTQAVSASLSAAQTGNVTILKSGTAATGVAYLLAQPSDGDTITIGLTGFLQVYRFKNTTAAINDVKIGADATATALNLQKAIMANGVGDGTDYHAGTTVNAYATATVSGTILTLTDKIACNRSLGWANTKSGTNISVSNLTGGVDGTTIATILAGGTNVYNALNLDDEALTSGNFPALLNLTSDAVRVGGKRFSIHIGASNVTTAMVTSYEYSTQGTPTVWRAGSVSISNLDNNQQVITPPEVVENLRIKINNTNTSAASINAKVVYGT